MERAAQLFAGRDAIVVTVWYPTVALGSHAWSGAFDSMLHFAEAARADAELGRRIADNGVRVAAAAGLTAEPLAVEATGPVWRTILEIADRHDATIVMGSRGLTGVRAWLGSVSSARCAPQRLDRRSSSRRRSRRVAGVSHSHGLRPVAMGWRSANMEWRAHG